ncbi:MAG: hypothetical protein EZS28_007091 [Streblomastix strix]|uniref:Protein kinase domain-containing protein n=1 Tax=Streblomastix strix TaxID=222440 RepID=A0A5J4WTC6_9EUKA|nr:MAG: hypothetical protein EZS28_007091 [Streblomastix strix]
MATVPAQNFAPGLNANNPSRKLLIHVSGSVKPWVTYLISVIILVGTGIALLLLLPGIAKFAAIILFVGAGIFLLIACCAGRKSLLNRDLLLDANEEFGSFTTSPYSCGKCCCLSTEHRQFNLREVVDVQQTQYRYGRYGQYTGFYVIFYLINNEEYKPPMVFDQIKSGQIIQFFREYNAQRQNQAPVQYASYPPINPNQQQYGQQQQTLYAPQDMQSIPPMQKSKSQPFFPRLINGLPSNLTSNYEILDALGEGSLAKVKKGKNIQTGQLVAIKFIEKSKIVSDPIQKQNLLTEITAMQSMKHPYIIELYEVYELEDKLCLVMELASGGFIQW